MTSTLRAERYRHSYGAYVAELGSRGVSSAVRIQSLVRGARVRQGEAGAAVAGLQRTEAERRRIYGPGWDEARVLSQLWVVKQGAWLIDVDASTSTHLARRPSQTWGETPRASETLDG